MPSCQLCNWSQSGAQESGVQPHLAACGKLIDLTTGSTKVGAVDDQVDEGNGNSLLSPFAIGLIVGVVVITFILTWTSALRRPFLDDDWSYLNTVQQSGWWHASAVWDPHNGLYRPVLFLWFGLLHSVFGLHPLGYHIATLAVVFLVGFLTWRIALTAGLKRGALVAGAVVLLHAAVVYPVSWTAAASSPISVAFGLGAILVLLNRPVTLPWGVVAALLLALGLLTREVVIVAPIIVVIVAWARPTGTLKDALLRSIPVWVADVGYVVLRVASGAGNPPGPYHQEVSGHALNNFFSLIVRASDVSGISAQLRTLAITGLFFFMMGTLVWSLVRRKYVVLAGLAWFVVATLPVIFLVNHYMETYYIDFALPGLALAFGASCELVAERVSDRIAIVAGVLLLVILGLVGHAVATTQFTHEYGADVAETQRLLAHVDRYHPNPAVGPELILVHVIPSAADEEAVTQNGNFFRVVLHDPALRVRLDH